MIVRSSRRMQSSRSLNKIENYKIKCLASAPSSSRVLQSALVIEVACLLRKAIIDAISGGGRFTWTGSPVAVSHAPSRSNDMTFVHKTSKNNVATYRYSIQNTPPGGCAQGTTYYLPCILYHEVHTMYHAQCTMYCKPSVHVVEHSVDWMCLGTDACPHSQDVANQ